MNDSLSVLLTNDDGIESVGFRALYDAFDEFADVTAVAPAADQSAVGRAMSHDVSVIGHDLGYAIEGTPADCTVVGLEALCPDVDMVVAGCNKGANIGAYVLGRSGTVSAAVEAAFFDVPSMAVSLYVPGGDVTWEEAATETADFREATRAATYLAKHALGAGVFEQADYLNVNAPMPSADGGPAPIQITEPSTLYDMTADHDGENGRIVLHDRVWDRMRSGDIPDPDGTDRRAIVEGRVSVSPLTAPHTTQHHEALDALAETYLS
jgi:5'-nucleotidase